MARLQGWRRCCSSASERGLDNRRQRVDRAALRPGAAGRDCLRRETQRLAMLGQRLGSSLRLARAERGRPRAPGGPAPALAIAVLQAQHAQPVAALAERLSLLDPRRVLGRSCA